LELYKGSSIRWVKLILIHGNDLCNIIVVL